MQRIQKHLQKIKGILVMMVMCGMFFSVPSTAQGFIASTNKNLGILLDKIDRPQWKIGYNFTADCPEAFRQQEAQLKEVITKALDAWLQPLRARYPNRQFTDDFLLIKLPDFVKCGEDKLSRNKLDTRITFDCKVKGRSFANRSLGSAPDLCIRETREGGIDRFFIASLVHELGHAFGLEDTYVRGHLQSSGGLAYTVEKQPSSVMSGGFLFAIDSPLYLGKDDKNGIIWLYKYLHEDSPAGDCFFPDYTRIEHDGRCRHEHPLIFEAKHGVFETVEMILRDDPKLEINARDSQGMTALHYAVERVDSEMVKALLAQAGIKVNLLNGHKRTPAQLARVLHQIHLAKRIEAHPTAKWQPVAWDVSPKGSLTTTWGALKRAR